MKQVMLCQDVILGISTALCFEIILPFYFATHSLFHVLCPSQQHDGVLRSPSPLPGGTAQFWGLFQPPASCACSSCSFFLWEAAWPLPHKSS